MSQPVNENGAFKNLSATAAVSSGPCQLIGFYVNSTSTGTLVLRDGGASGTVLCGTITPAIGFHRYPATIGTSLHATIANTLDVTFFFASGN
tara:strand:- start:2628 stop:2903 length:276 start_codon:yes stop_codon:yes gene_type:complete